MVERIVEEELTLDLNLTGALSELTELEESSKKITHNAARKGTGEPKLTYRFIKRAMDMVLSLLALMVLLPLMLIVALAIKIDSKGPVMFKQMRVGKGGRKFTMYKFRSMIVDAESKKEMLSHLNEKGGIIFKIKKDPRVTRVGKVIRKTSIDELPQLFNVIKSDMSIVGPRPPLPDEVERYNAYQRQRLSVKGGLTCYWQVGGRSDLDFEQWVELDLKYIRENSILEDIKIILKTFVAVISCKGSV